MFATTENTVLTSIGFIFLLLYVFLIRKGFTYLKNEKQDKFCIYLFITFFMLCCLNRLLSIIIDLLSFESHLLKSNIHNSYALIYGIYAFLSIVALIRFSSNKYTLGNKQAATVFVFSLLLSFVAIFQGKEEYSNARTLERLQEYKQPLELVFVDKNYAFSLPNNSGYKEADGFLEKSRHADFALRDSDGNYFFSIISEIDDSIYLKNETPSLENYIENVLESMGENVDRVEVKSRQKLSFKTIESERLSIISHKDKYQFYFDIHFFHKDKVFYQLIMYKNWNCDLKVLSQKADLLINGFNFLKP